MGRAVTRIGRAGKGAPADRLFFREGAGHSYRGYAAAAFERQLVRKAHLPLLQGGLDESRGAGIGPRGRAGGRGHIGRGADRRSRTRWTKLAFRTGGGNLCDTAAAAEIGSRTGPAVDHDGWTFGAYRDSGSDWPGRRSKV